MPKPDKPHGKPPPPGNNIPAPTGLTLTEADPINFGYATVDLSWNSVANATTYWIWRSDLPTQPIAIWDRTNYKDAYAPDGVEISYQVAAVVSENLGTRCTPVTIKT